MESIWDRTYTDCLRELNWPTLACRRHYYVIDYIHSMFHNGNSLSFHDYFQFNSSPTRSHALSIQPVTSTINSYRYSFLYSEILCFCGTMYL